MEHGTYSWNALTGEFVVVEGAGVTQDTNGEWGLSHPQDPTTVTVNGNTLTFTDQSGTFELFRVTQ